MNEKDLEFGELNLDDIMKEFGADVDASDADLEDTQDLLAAINGIEEMTAEQESDPEETVVEILPEDVPLTELPDDEVPLASVPMTGDASALWMLMSVLSGASLAGVTVLGRKKIEEN